MPSAAATRGSQVASVTAVPDVPTRVAAQRNSAVSRPSRPTARTATTTSDQRPAAASSTRPRSSLPMPREARAIQKIIQVTNPTAMIESVPPISSCASNVSPRGPNVSAAPNARLTSTARATPAQMRGSRCRLSVFTR